MSKIIVLFSPSSVIRYELIEQVKVPEPLPSALYCPMQVLVGGRLLEDWASVLTPESITRTVNSVQKTHSQLKVTHCQATDTTGRRVTCGQRSIISDYRRGSLSC